VKIDIGGGTIPRSGYENLDPNSGVGEWRRTIQEGIPAADNSVEAVCASHVFEHIPAGKERIEAFNEVHRVLVPGGKFEIILPTFVAGTWQAIADPTHVSLWVRESFLYFVRGTAFTANAEYGIKYWDEESFELRDGWEAHCILVKP
jgi:predicted SAM-dependent methyltransferase